MSATPRDETIGPYRLGRILGHGSRGIVYEAERIDVPRRAVALKIVDLSDRDEVAAKRFTAECNALAKLDHPGIARVFDAGRFDDSRGFIAMELASGLRIDLHCDQRRLGIRARLELFRALAEAAAHAHGRGVVHRDIKPANVLVIEGDGAPAVKVIDFGLALELDRRSQLTKTREILGTEAYLSPEQARAIPGPVDARSDVYSLGVLLYLLMTGDLPYADTAGHHPAVSQGGQGRPPHLPSETFLGDDTEWRALKRDATADELHRELSGDVDRVVMQALETKPDERYRDAGAFADDVERILTGRPAAAGPPSFSRRVRDFTRRHRGLVVATILIFVALLGYSAAATRSVFAARESLESLSTHNGLVHDLLFSSTRLLGQSGRTEAIREHLEGAVEYAKEELAGSPEELASVLAMISSAFSNLGDFDREVTLLEDALDAWANAPSPDPIAYGSALGHLGAIYEGDGRTERSVELLDRAIETLKGAGPDSIAAQDQLFTVYQQAGHIAMRCREYERADLLLREARSILEDWFPESWGRLAEQEYSRAILEWSRGDLERAETRMEAACDLAEEHLDPLSYELPAYFSELALIRIERGDFAGADAPSRRAMEMSGTAFASMPLADAIYVSTRFEWALAAGEFDEARELLTRVERLQETDTGPAKAIARLHRARLSYGEARANSGENVEARKRDVEAELERLTEEFGAFPTLLRRVRRELDA